MRLNRRMDFKRNSGACGFFLRNQDWTGARFSFAIAMLTAPGGTGEDSRCGISYAAAAAFALTGSILAFASSASARASGDRSFHREGGREGCCRCDSSLSPSGTDPSGVGISRAGPLRRHLAMAYAATAQDETNCKLPITWSTATNDISLLSTLERISLAENTKKIPTRHLSDPAAFRRRAGGGELSVRL